MTEHNLPDKDDAPWLDCMDGFQAEGLTRCNCHDRNSMIDLSPATKAVPDASNLLPGKDSFLILAAALRATADQVNHHWDGMECVDYLCAIANELEQA